MAEISNKINAEKKSRDATVWSSTAVLPGKISGNVEAINNPIDQAGPKTNRAAIGWSLCRCHDDHSSFGSISESTHSDGESPLLRGRHAGSPESQYSSRAASMLLAQGPSLKQIVEYSTVIHRLNRRL